MVLYPSAKALISQIKLKLIVDTPLMKLMTHAVLRGRVTVRCNVDPIFYWCGRKCEKSTVAQELCIFPYKCREACLAWNKKREKGIKSNKIQWRFHTHFLNRFFTTKISHNLLHVSLACWWGKYLKKKQLYINDGQNFLI